ncbi:hypothetical protein FK514_29290, partial [Klebsiella pneumoniae]|nr:hypothetical protein [Klebsiella pneumoniae]
MRRAGLASRWSRSSALPGASARTRPCRSPSAPVLILWMNMATSATLSFGLAFEAAERNVMNRPQKRHRQPDQRLTQIDG